MTTANTVWQDLAAAAALVDQFDDDTLERLHLQRLIRVDDGGRLHIGHVPVGDTSVVDVATAERAVMNARIASGDLGRLPEDTIHDAIDHIEGTTRQEIWRLAHRRHLHITPDNVTVKIEMLGMGHGEPDTYGIIRTAMYTGEQIHAALAGETTSTM